MRRFALTSALAASFALAGCDLFGAGAEEKATAAKDAEGKAIGGACRHAGRAIEDCYTLNKKADKAAVFAGWRDMNDYMRENKIDPVTPQVPVASGKGEGKVAEGKVTEAKGQDKSAPVVESRPAAVVPVSDTRVATESRPAEAKPAPSIRPELNKPPLPKPPVKEPAR